MVLPLITADQRLKEPHSIKGCIFGKSDIGKTSLLRTLPEETTLFFDLKAGNLVLEGWRGNTMRPRPWEECRDLAVLIGDPNPRVPAARFYSRKHFYAVCQSFDSVEELTLYETVFIDSITVAARLCFAWCKAQPKFLSDKIKKTAIRGPYGLMAQEMIAWLSRLQHTRNKNIWFLDILDEKTDDFNRRYFEPQIEGTKTGLELSGIVDQVITMAAIDREGNASGKAQRTPYWAFVCHTINPYGYPAKDRSGRLDCIEESHLDHLMAKIQGKFNPVSQRLDDTCPHSSIQQESLGD